MFLDFYFLKLFFLIYFPDFVVWILSGCIICTLDFPILFQEFHFLNKGKFWNLKFNGSIDGNKIDGDFFSVYHLNNF